MVRQSVFRLREIVFSRKGEKHHSDRLYSTLRQARAVMLEEIILKAQMNIQLAARVKAPIRGPGKKEIHKLMDEIENHGMTITELTIQS